MSVFHVCWDELVGGGGGGRGVSGRLKRRKAIMGDFLLAQWGRDPALSDRLRSHISALTHQHAHMHCRTDVDLLEGVEVCVWVEDRLPLA